MSLKRKVLDWSEPVVVSIEQRQAFLKRRELKIQAEMNRLAVVLQKKEERDPMLFDGELIWRWIEKNPPYDYFFPLFIVPALHHFLLPVVPGEPFKYRCTVYSHVEYNNDRVASSKSLSNRHQQKERF